MTIKKILLVEDEKIIAELMKLELTAEGYDVTTVYNGIQALSAINDNHFDLIITDLFMPEMDGIDLLKQLKSASNTIPTVVISASQNDNIKNQLNNLGITQFIDKPINNERLDLLLSLIDDL